MLRLAAETTLPINCSVPCKELVQAYGRSALYCQTRNKERVSPAFNWPMKLNVTLYS